VRFLGATPRSLWLSVGGGISVAYVFVHLLPDLAEEQEAIREAVGEEVSFLQSHVYLVALVGLSIFYGLERAAREARRRNRSRGREDFTGAPVFWLHVASFSAYNALIGYLLVHREEPGFQSLILYTFAMAVHFAVNDYGLRRDHKDLYHDTGRWVLAAAIIAGWVVGISTGISEAAIAVLFAFLAGGIVLNVLKEELAEERVSSFFAFILGAAAYTVILLIAF
jgi:hypothetical protein